MWEPGSKQEALDGRHHCQTGRLNLRLDELTFSQLTVLSET